MKKNLKFGGVLVLLVLFSFSCQKESYLDNIKVAQGQIENQRTTLKTTEQFEFAVSLFTRDEPEGPVVAATGTLTVESNGVELYNGPLVEGLNRIVISNEPIYSLKIEKEGYVTYQHEFTYAELDVYKIQRYTVPLEVILEKQSNVNLIMGLVAYYPFNGNPNDESGNEYNGTDFGAAGYLTSSFDQARTFTNDPTVGVNATDYVTIPNVIASEEFSINLWVNFQYRENHQTLLYLSEGNDWVNANFFFDFDSYGKLVVVLNGLDLRTIDYSHYALITGQLNDAYLNSAALEMNQYYNITCTFKESGLTLYVDGVEYAKYLNVNRVVGNPDAGIKLGVCAHPNPDFLYYPLVGQMDELRFYNRALNVEEIQMLSNM